MIPQVQERESPVLLEAAKEVISSIQKPCKKLLRVANKLTDMAQKVLDVYTFTAKKILNLYSFLIPKDKIDQIKGVLSKQAKLLSGLDLLIQVPEFLKKVLQV